MAANFKLRDEKRRYVRLKNSLPTQYNFSSQGRHGAALTYDISECGIRMILEEFVPRLSRMSLQINLTPHKLISVDGEVKWIRQITHSYRYQAGIEFKDLSDDARRSISECMTSILSNK